jgi:[ribosomal protein S18]-alanine N-acetyltransferase
VSLPLFLDAATEADVPALVGLEKQSFTHPWTEGNFREVVSGASRATVLVLREARGPGSRQTTVVVAYCVCQVVADELHILDLAVAPERQRRGLGRWLLVYALARASRRGADRAFLEVRRSNEAAIGLYQALGFSVLAERRGYYRDPGEDALVLQKSGLSSAVAAAQKDP